MKIRRIYKNKLYLVISPPKAFYVKKCSCCGFWQSEENFYGSPNPFSKPYHLSSECKECCGKRRRLFTLVGGGKSVRDYDVFSFDIETLENKLAKEELKNADILGE